MTPQRFAAVDCGTNSIRLLIADVDAGSARSIVDVDRRMEIVRLGHGVDANGRFDPAALRRTLAVADEYARQCRAADVSGVRFIATSASRDASNADEFLDGVRDIFADFGATAEVITGRTEAELSFTGATAELAGARTAAPPYLVVDIGGGSTEFVLGRDRVEQTVSVDIGCVRLTERHVTRDPISEDEAWAALADITAAIDHAAGSVDFTRVGTLIGVAGSVTTVTAAALALDTYDPRAIHGARLSVAAVTAAANELIRADRGARQTCGFMHPGRVDVIGVGALIWRTVVQRIARDAGITHAHTSEHDILDGAIWSQVAPEPAG